ncbi:MAG: hypothetical protein MI919_11060, partial [Holophagales bacterium]|nr:hypothetical protein [Holophagales bacterium]
MDRFGAYQEILASIPKSFLPGRDSSTSALEQILPKAVRSCKGNVLYSVHRVENNKIRYMWCGPEELQFLRLETKELPMSQGCMGKTVELGVPFKIWNNVRKSADSKKVFVDSAPDHTQSELVVIMPSTTNAQVLEILNLESDVLDAFDNIDAQAFWAIGMWASLLRSSQDALEDQRGILKEVSRILAGTSILTSDEDPSKPGRFRPSLVQTLRRSIPFDAISVISFTPQELLGTLTVDYHDGFGEDPLVLDGFADDWESFSAHR